MFYDFYNMFTSSEQIGAEYEGILKRARVMDEIVKYSNSSER